MMQRGVDQRQELDPRLLIRDTRTLGQRVYDFFTNPTLVGITLLSSAVGAFIFTPFTDLILIFGIGAFFFAFMKKSTLPFRLPKHSNKLDYNDIAPGTKKPRKAGGIMFFGNEKSTNAELWFTNEDMRTHMLIFGSTGSGKTETLVSLAYNALIQASGFIYVDGKGDNSLYSKIFSIVRQMGREDDLLLVNFMTGARDIIGPQKKRLSNTMNPFSIGSSSMLAQLVVSLMDQSAQTPDGDMWKGRAISFVEALMKLLVPMRDEGNILLDAHAVRYYFVLERIETIILDKSFPRDNGLPPVSLESQPDAVLEPLRTYLDTLPGYDKNKKGKQSPQCLEQHGFITMQLTRVFTSLADTYGHILRTKLAEVDMKDVVLNRRILVVLLPAMEKSPDELSNLGKIIIATLKAMMAAGLGDEVEGDVSELVDRKPTNAPTPYLCILDEYGYYAVQGFAVVPAQARSLGFSTIFAGQDLPAFQKVSKEEAASIGANTNIKVAMKIEDPIETYEFFSKTAGEAYVTKVDAFQTKAESITNTYLDTRSSSFEKRARIDLLDLKEQTEGECHVFFKSKIVRARVFYANPKIAKRIRVNQMLKVETISSEKLLELEQQVRKFDAALSKINEFTEKAAENDEIKLITNYLRESEDLRYIEKSVSALVAFHNHNVEEQHPEEEIEIADEQLNLFTKFRLGTRPKEQILTNNYEEFEKPLLDKITARERIEIVERASGKMTKHASNIAEELVKDMQVATFYPPRIPERKEAIDVTKYANNLTSYIQYQRKKAKDKPAETTE